MTGKQYVRLLKALGMSSGEACERLRMSRTSEWRCRQEGPPFVVGECLKLLLHIKVSERRDARAYDGFGRPRIHVHAPEDRRGGLPAAVVQPRKRKPKAERVAELEAIPAPRSREQYDALMNSESGGQVSHFTRGS